ncbi:uncharacterized protein CDV56_100709 [Aspergillus thermomutatus]|uniref:CorA-like transporter domain-containing protein n=1 Tax=Aspergillus thermomutatus TaxID=41047 RepID=A0A397G2N8_ASPTH|nr:uncharacterized protein CDV56_100709 [Aspergillus thermomutatus]RHZ43576.1 hypothetical protein CDV56_100709 [Aspergillus thermomutatus]
MVEQSFTNRYIDEKKLLALLRARFPRKTYTVQDGHLTYAVKGQIDHDIIALDAPTMARLSNRSQVDLHLMEKVQSRRDRLFKAHNNRPQLELTSIFKSRDAHGCWSVRLESPVKINDLSELRQVEEAENDACIQIYTVRHLRSWTTLDISYETIEHLLAAHNVFDHFWRCMLTFGIKFQENEYDFPPFRANNEQNTHSRVNELAYVIRRVEPNNSSTDKGVCPWSIRQTGVYHKMIYPNRYRQNALRSTSVFILIAPSRAAERIIAQRLPENVSQDDTFGQDFLIHEHIVRDSLKGWMDYQVWLEAECKQIANRVLVLDILQRGNNGEPRSIYVSAEDRQRLKQLDDYITDMLVILQTMVDSISRIGTACRRHCQTSCDGTGSCLCSNKIEEFGEYAAEAQTSLNRAKILRERVQSTEQLCLHLSDLLAYEEAAALTQLAHASRIESQEMVKLAAQSARDAAAVKVLTIIGLVYLPTTIVSNFFSTEFVHLNDKGNLQISHQVWILAVVSAPLTVLTVITWWLCDRYRVIEAMLERKEESSLENGGRQSRPEEGRPSRSSSVSLNTLARPL